MVKRITTIFSDDRQTSIARTHVRLFGRLFTPAEERNRFFRIFGGLRRWK